MIIINRHHLRAEFRQMRLNRKLTQTELGRRLHVGYRTVMFRETGRHHLGLDDVLQTAAAFGYELALVPTRHPNTRATGTGWPA